MLWVAGFLQGIIKWFIHKIIRHDCNLPRCIKPVTTASHWPTKNKAIHMKTSSSEPPKSSYTVKHHSSLHNYLSPPPPSKSHSGTSPSQNEHMGLPTGLLTGTHVPLWCCLLVSKNTWHSPTLFTACQWIYCYL